MKRDGTTYIFITGIIMILFLLGGCFVYKVWQTQNELESTIIPEELMRESTIEQIYDPEDIVRYMLQASEKKDLDMALRGFPIDEMALGVDTKKVIEEKGAFSNSLTISPSAQYAEYFPISSAELTGEFARSFNEFSTQMNNLGNLRIVRVDYVRPDVQISPEYQLKAKQLCVTWGAQNSTELVALLSDGARFYTVGFTAIQYWDYWKIFLLESELVEGTTENQLFLETTQEEYSDFIVKGKRQILEKILTSDNTKEQLEKWKEEEKEVKGLLDSEDALLPPNYFVVNRAYGRTPKDTIEKFTVYIEKQDMTSMLNYGNGEKDIEKEHVTPDILIHQKEFAIQIKNFYFNLLRAEDGTKEKTLEKLGQNADSIVKMQNPEMMFYMDLMNVETTNKKIGEYTASYYYGGDAYKVKFYLKKSENGWWIYKIGSVKNEEFN